MIVEQKNWNKKKFKILIKNKSFYILFIYLNPLAKFNKCIK